MIDDLGRFLYWLTVDGDLLDDLVVPRQPTSGENAGCAPQRGRSKPPVVLGVVDVKASVESTLGWWCGQLAAAAPSVGSPPASRRISSRAQWLREHVDVAMEMPWADLMAEEVGGQARLVRDLVMPPVSDSDPEPIAEGTVREVASWLRSFGLTTSKSTLHRWVAAGKLDSRARDDGRVIVSLADAAELARQQKFRGGTPPSVS